MALERSEHRCSLYLGALTTVGSLLLSTTPYAESVANTSTSFSPSSGQACVSVQNDAARLSCYDTYFKAQTKVKESLVAENVDVKEETPKTATTEPLSITDKLKQSVGTIYKQDVNVPMNPVDSLLDSRWELSEKSKLGTWNMRAYKPVYVFPAFWTSDKNLTPYSPNPDNQVPQQDIDSTELKFQLSFKTKALENIFGNNGDLWVGYTQSSRWQAYNARNSSPFRETDYEPEASLIFRTNYNLLGLNGRLLGLTVNHQSNGREDPYSRSWNRVMLNIGLERDNFALIFRPWYRLPESAKNDNNPDITDYMGRADLTAFYKWNENNFSLMLRHSLRGGDASHGAVQFDWSFPIKGKLRGQFQYFNGYGESLIDYNHRANYVGLGVSLMDWF
ncbi:phospholipase A [Acinetobacter pollinis]|uniref:Phospholipase A1 n=1 Tax=Acinetobacter pollinis TaxID=2605270 RepID=A0ABU6DUX9_9GAMM|nr:phospholipase A [Acinetobacter pollinis]MEB5477467.1 phospholipase A [Acinetobacter pollinis]